MIARRTEMHRLQEVVRLHRLGKSRRTIARQLRMGRDTIRTYLDAIGKAGRLEGDPEDPPAVGDLRAIVSEHVASREPPRASSSVERWRPQIKQLLDHGAP